MYTIEDKIDAIMEALELLLVDNNRTNEADDLYRVRSGYNDDE